MRKSDKTAVVIFDSLYGNTQKVAEKIADGLREHFSVELVVVSQVGKLDWEKVDVLVVGSPVHGGRPTPAIQAFVTNLPLRSHDGVRVAAFDTRFQSAEHGMGLKLLMKAIGYAAEKIAHDLEHKGGKLVVPAEGFIVEGKEGPLKNGELERALAWGRSFA
jgi:flavodoxin